MIVGDLEDPVAELVGGLVRPYGVERTYEGLLREILGQRPIADHPVDEREDGSLVTDEQFAEGWLATTSSHCGELAVLERRIVRS